MIEQSIRESNKDQEPEEIKIKLSFNNKCKRVNIVKDDFTIQTLTDSI